MFNPRKVGFEAYSKNWHEDYLYKKSRELDKGNLVIKNKSYANALKLC